MSTAEQDLLQDEEEFDYSQKIEIRKIDTSAPMRWLSKGISDFKVAPLMSLSYGFMYALVGLVLIYLTYNNPIYTYGMVTIFYLAGPVIAVGLYGMSRHIEAGEKPEFSNGYSALCFNPAGIIGFSIVIGLLIVFWTVMAAAIFAVFLGSLTISGDILNTLSANEQLIPFIGLIMVIGFVFAVLTFMLSAISIPLMTHRKVDVATAMITSFRAVKKNPLVMFVWAFAIVALIGLGLAFAFVGIAITLPIVGHASWHAYRELVVDDRVMTTQDCDLRSFPKMKGKL